MSTAGSPEPEVCCTATGPHSIHRDALGREWRTTLVAQTPITGLHMPTHREQYGAVVIEAREGVAPNQWAVVVAHAYEPGVVFACIPDLTAFETGREFQRQVDHWRPIGLEQGRVFLESGR